MRTFSLPPSPLFLSSFSSPPPHSPFPSSIPPSPFLCLPSSIYSSHLALRLFPSSEASILAGIWGVATPRFWVGVVGIAGVAGGRDGSWMGPEKLLYLIMFRKYVRKAKVVIFDDK